MNRTNLDWLTSYLDANECRYEIDSFSHDFSDQEMVEMTEQLGVTFIKTQVIQVGGRHTILAVRSKNLIDPEKVRNSFQTKEVEFLEKKDILESFPLCPGGVVPPFGSLLDMDVVLDQSVALSKAVKFRVSPENDFLRMDFQDFKRLFKPRMNNLHMSSFRAGVTSVVPVSETKTWEAKESCFIGISLDNANFEGPRLDAVLKWAGKHFRTTGILIADSIHRITLQILDPSLSEEEARVRALLDGKAFAEKNEAFFSGKKYACRFELVACSDLEKSPSFLPFRDDLRRLYSEHDRFRLSVHGFAEGFIDKKFSADALPDPERRQKSIQMSVDYFLEELALCACLMKEGSWPVLVYPGSLTVFTDMIEDGFDSQLEVVTLLRSLISLSLNLKGD